MTPWVFYRSLISTFTVIKVVLQQMMQFAALPQTPVSRTAKLMTSDYFDVADFGVFQNAELISTFLILSKVQLIMKKKKNISYLNKLSF